MFLPPHISLYFPICLHVIIHNRWQQLHYTWHRAPQSVWRALEHTWVCQTCAVPCLMEGWGRLGSFLSVFKSERDLPTSSDRRSGWCNHLSYQRKCCHWLQRWDPLGSNKGGWNERRGSLTEESPRYSWYILSKTPPWLPAIHPI